MLDKHRKMKRTTGRICWREAMKKEAPHLRGPRLQ